MTEGEWESLKNELQQLFGNSRLENVLPLMGLHYYRGTPYFGFENTPEERRQMVRDRYQWGHANCQGKYMFFDNAVAIFEIEDDCVLFKLSFPA